MPTIHPSSVIEQGARIGEGTVIGPFCYIGGKVTIGANCRLVSHVAVLGNTTIGDGNVIWPQATLGADPQDLKFDGEDSRLIIGDNNEIRELVTMHLGTANGGGVTTVGSENLIMAGAHVAHDCEIGSFVLIANNVGLSGHVKVEDHANIAGAVGVHHFVTFGQYSYTGGMSRVVHDVPPFMIAEGDPAEVRGPNLVGLKRNMFDEGSIEALKKSFLRLYGRSSRNSTEPVTTRIDLLESEFAENECVKILAQSLRQSISGRNGRFREASRQDNRHVKAQGTTPA
jgi:UDP-N-acetylglucosamine acyltransferase